MSYPDYHAHLAVDEYLLNEDGADCRHEYINGQVYAMTGASDRHGLMTLNIATSLRPHLRGTPCQLFANDMKVHLRIQEQDIFYYPDVLLSCDPTDRATYYRCAPCLLIEVLSDSTERIDRREKLWAYQTLPSLQEYVLIAQNERLVDIYRRANHWKAEVVTEGSVVLTDLALDLSLDMIYEDVIDTVLPAPAATLG